MMSPFHTIYFAAGGPQDAIISMNTGAFVYTGQSFVTRAFGVPVEMTNGAVDFNTPSFTFIEDSTRQRAMFLYF